MLVKVKLIEYLSDVMQKRSEQENCCGLGIEFVCRKKIRNLLGFFFIEIGVFLKSELKFLFIIFWSHYPFMEMLLQEYYYLDREMINYTGFKPTASCRRQPKLFARLPAIFHQRTRILLKILCLLIFRLKLKSLSYYGEHFISGNKATTVLNAVCKCKRI